MVKGLSGRKKPAEEPVLPKVTICIAQDGDEVYFRYVRNKKIQNLLSLYCKEKNIDYGSVEFLFNGKRIATGRNANQLGMVDGDQIDVMTHNIGGG
ncbi:hypothetical protein ABFX02_07G067300 [Erythranthe guttata]